jgi:hypothetical protein
VRVAVHRVRYTREREMFSAPYVTESPKAGGIASGSCRVTYLVEFTLGGVGLGEQGVQKARVVLQERVPEFRRVTCQRMIS